MKKPSKKKIIGGVIGISIAIVLFIYMLSGPNICIKLKCGQDPLINKVASIMSTFNIRDDMKQKFIRCQKQSFSINTRGGILSKKSNTNISGEFKENYRNCIDQLISYDSSLRQTYINLIHSLKFTDEDHNLYKAWIECCKGCIKPVPVPVPEPTYSCERLQGLIDSSATYGSGWLILKKTVNMQKESKLILKIGGDAEKVLIRLLKKGENPNDAQGIIETIDVPQTKIIEVKLHSKYDIIEQISVHGGKNPFGKFKLGANNGDATLEWCEYCIIKK